MNVTQHLELETVLRSAGADGTGAAFAVAVLVGDRLEEASTGVANPELDLPMTSDTLVQVGSTTKVMNAVLVMRLVELGILDLDRPVRDVIAGFGLSDEAATDALTLRQCLAMTSGIDGSIAPDAVLDDSLAQCVAALSEGPQLFPPGGGFSYSSPASVVAGHAAEQATGRRWDDLLAEHVLDPAGMVHTETRPDRMMFHRAAVGLGPGGEVVRPWYPAACMGPAGSTGASTAGDLVRLARVFLSGGCGATGTRVLSPESVGLMTEPVVAVPTEQFAQSWCLGPHWSDTGTHVVLGHPGGNTSGAALLWWIPALDAAIATVTNSVWSFEVVKECQARIARLLGCEPHQDLQPEAGGRRDDDQAVGVYERRDARYHVTIEGDALYVELEARGHAEDAPRTAACLSPAGASRYLPERSLSGFGPPAPIAFAGYAGVQVLLDGHAAARRVPC